MKKKDLMELFRNQLDRTWKEAESAVESALEIIKQVLEQGRG